MYGQPSQEGFTVYNTRLLQILIVGLPHENGKGEGKRGKTQTAEGTVQSKKRDKIAFTR